MDPSTSRQQSRTSANIYNKQAGISPVQHTPHSERQRSTTPSLHIHGIDSPLLSHPTTEHHQESLSQDYNNNSIILKELSSFSKHFASIFCKMRNISNRKQTLHEHLEEGSLPTYLSKTSKTLDKLFVLPEGHLDATNSILHANIQSLEGQWNDLKDNYDLRYVTIEEYLENFNDIPNLSLDKNSLRLEFDRLTNEKIIQFISKQTKDKNKKEMKKTLFHSKITDKKPTTTEELSKKIDLLTKKLSNLTTKTKNYKGGTSRRKKSPSTKNKKENNDPKKKRKQTKFSKRNIYKE